MDSITNNRNQSPEFKVLKGWSHDLEMNIKALTNLIASQKNEFGHLEKKVDFSKSGIYVFPMRSVMGIAASLVIVFLAVVMLQSSTPFVPATYTTQISKQDIDLKDGSEVVLDKASKIQTFTERSIAMDGRAFFKVESSPINPFDIETKYGDVQVLGTEFSLDVSGDKLKLYVREGVVKYHNSGKAVMVYAGNYIEAKDGDFIMGRVPSNHLSWYNGKIEFKSASPDEVISTINNHFKLSLTRDDISGGNGVSFNSRYTNPNLEDILKDLAKYGYVINEASF